MNFYIVKRNAFKKGRVSFGKNNLIRGDCNFGHNIILGDNVEIRCGHAKIIIGDQVTINRNSLLIGKVTIGNNVAIAPNCVIVGSNHVFKRIDIPINRQGLTTQGIIIKDNVWIGANCTVLDGVTIGEGSVIGGGAVVTKSIPPFSIAVGNPAKVIKKRQ